VFNEKILVEIEQARREYEERMEDILKKHGKTELGETTVSSIPLKRLYTPLDIATVDYLKDIGFPGIYPFTRGVMPTGYQTKGWTVRQVVGIGTAEDTNERLRYLFEQGQTGFSVCGMGYDPYESSDERSLGMLGRGGVWIDTLADIETLFKGIDMEKISINQIGCSIPVFAMILAEAQRRGIPLAKLRGTIQNWVVPGGEGPRLEGNGTIDIIEYCSKNLPLWNHTSISVRNIRDQGISAPQEIAFGLYLGLYTIKSSLARGLNIDQVAPRVSFFLSAENEFLEEVAKYRAMRRMWARLMREEMGAKDPRSWLMRFHVQTTALNLTAQQPYNNLIRSTIHALAAILGGAQSLSVNSFDEALAIPTTASATLSVRIQQIIFYETGVAKVLDPLGGSYCVESLTNQLEEQAQGILDYLGRLSPEKAFRYMEEEADEAGYKRQQAIDQGERVLVGVNKFVMGEEPIPVDSVKLQEYDPNWRERQIARLEKVKKERDPKKVRAAKEMLAQAYRERVNIIEPMIEAVKAYLSIGEIAQVRKEVFGSLDLSWFCGKFFGM
jgi:methylmalonyl-CoA mutase N-terminal domain/subunit